MANKRKYISTEYGMVNLRDGDTILHLDPEFLADIYWRVLDGELTEVVRCKDCTMWNKERQMCDRFSSTWTAEHTKPNDYCCWGERREDADAVVK